MSTISELSPVKFVSYSSEYEKIEDHPFIEAIKYDIYHFMYKLGYGTKKLLGKSDLLLIDKNKLDRESVIYLLGRVFDKRPLSFKEKKELISTITKIQQYEFKIIKKRSSYNRYEIRNQIKRIIESKI